ncbi:MAG: hypothetical protein VX498_12365 [Myxococcota bacterium]|nr:hypothetical protein [Myxococcota bacterium]
MTALTLAWLSASATLAGVLAYWLYTLGGLSPIAPLLGLPRRLLLAAAALGLLASLSWARTGDVVLPAVLGLSALAYAWSRQWLRCPEAPVLVPGDLSRLAEGSWVAVLPDGRAVPIALLVRLRTVRLADRLVVHCSLARSLACFEAPVGPLRADLPHASGFSIRSGGRRWDGVDGSALDGGDALARHPVDLCSAAAWRDRHPSGELFVLSLGEELPELRTPSPRLPGLRGVEDPMAWGRADSLRWEVLPSGERGTLDLAALPGGGEASYLLSRWAARARGLDAPEGRNERGERA